MWRPNHTKYLCFVSYLAVRPQSLSFSFTHHTHLFLIPCNQPECQNHCLTLLCATSFTGMTSAACNNQLGPCPVFRSEVLFCFWKFSKCFLPLVVFLCSCSFVTFSSSAARVTSAFFLPGRVTFTFIFCNRTGVNLNLPLGAGCLWLSSDRRAVSLSLLDATLSEKWTYFWTYIDYDTAAG